MLLAGGHVTDPALEAQMRRALQRRRDRRADLRHGHVHRLRQADHDPRARTREHAPHHRPHTRNLTLASPRCAYRRPRARPVVVLPVVRGRPGPRHGRCVASNRSSETTTRRTDCSAACAHTRRTWRRARPDDAPATDHLQRVFTAERPNLPWSLTSPSSRPARARSTSPSTTCAIAASSVGRWTSTKMCGTSRPALQSRGSWRRSCRWPGADCAPRPSATAPLERCWSLAGRHPGRSRCGIITR